MKKIIIVMVMGTMMLMASACSRTEKHVAAGAAVGAVAGHIIGGDTGTIVGAGVGAASGAIIADRNK